MWLLSTDRAELHSFHSPDIIPGGYAILSHVWGENEQTFQEIQQLQIACATSSVDLIAHHKYGPAMSLNPRDHVCEKIRKEQDIAVDVILEVGLEEGEELECTLTLGCHNGVVEGRSNSIRVACLGGFKP